MRQSVPTSPRTRAVPIGPSVKTALLWLLLAFIVYTVIASPAKAGRMVRETFDGAARPVSRWAVLRRAGLSPGHRCAQPRALPLVRASACWRCGGTGPRLADPSGSALAGVVVLMWLDQARRRGARSSVTCCSRAGWPGRPADLAGDRVAGRLVRRDRPPAALRSGIITRKVAMMPLIKVTDIGYCGRRPGGSSATARSSSSRPGTTRRCAGSGTCRGRTASTWRSATCSSAPRRRSPAPPTGATDHARSRALPGS